MALLTRKDFYDIKTIDGIDERDYLATSIHRMNLSTIREYKITQITEYRPDLVSSIMFNTYHLGWLIALHNDMIDPVLEFTMGRMIEIPSLEEYYRFYNNNSRNV